MNKLSKVFCVTIPIAGGLLMSSVGAQALERAAVAVSHKVISFNQWNDTRISSAVFGLPRSIAGPRHAPHESAALSVTGSIKLAAWRDGMWVEDRPPTDDSSDSLISVLLLIALIALPLYFLPSMIAFKRRHPNRWVILLLNAFLGGTGIIWFGCIIWALHAYNLER